MFNFLILIIGFGLLLKGAAYFVDGSSSISLKLKISPLIVGLTIVAFGTSTPELLVSSLASWQGANNLAFGTIVGSNIANIALVIGISALFVTLTIRSVIVAREVPFMILSILVLIVLVFDERLTGGSQNILSRSDGIILIFFFSIFIYYLFSSALKSRAEGFLVRWEIHKDRITSTAKLSTAKTTLYFLGGLGMIIVGSKLVVDSATDLSQILGVGQGFIGLTIVALGTSLPELATSLTAAFKKEVDIAVGNMIGSNIFNVFFVLGITAIISPITFDTALAQEIVLMLFVFVLFFIFALNRRRINRYEGAILLGMYIFFLGFLFYSEFLA
ncbi:calcium/sodium antiporter [Patescibacteria group bacterium]|nr:calcium/sodium antiporter [Patescibacteria group bacterium]